MSMGDHDDARAWGEFWKANAGGDSTGCLPERWAAIETAQRAAWRGFAEGLRQGARLLDLATGDGRVLRWLREERRDLDLQGIDRAPKLPPAPEGTATRGGIAMEDLPFADDSFDAVTSQFGFEYGDVAAVAGEIARVLGPDGRVGLMVHRGDGPILEHNRARRSAILWAIEEKAVPATVIRALHDPRGGIAAAAQVAAALTMLGEKAHGRGTPAWEIPEAVRRAIMIGADRGAQPGAIETTIEAIAAQAENELGRIASLARACERADARADIKAAFAAHGLEPGETVPVAEPSGRALADFLTFS
ncbi:Methyltransferase domain-containing protein [Erythrobacter litoralis]|uniref:Methyltransferase type 11 domain-containing protein n=2 Tax=Erythrobacter litoralis TaxID=39960 RepID=A0A074MKM6_9SPHN|nr:Methyltransferase domain-containing protein [Erythrobacter litoralis]KEO93355.1 hypothetical protein EH32_11585 [Erythrobacter litoralis]